MRQRLDTILEKVLIAIMVLMVLDVVWQVVSRYLLSAPSTFTDELAGFLLIWLGLLGAAYASGKGQHLAIDILPNKLTSEGKRRLDIIINGIIILFAISVMFIGGINLVYLTFLLDQKSASLNIPLGYIYVSVPLSGLFIVIYALSNIKVLILSRS